MQDTTATTPNHTPEADSTLAAILEGHQVHPKRVESLQLAIALGADSATLATLRDSRLLARKPTVILPANRLENLSRGRGWCRQGRGSNVAWGPRTNNGYQVGPGRWAVGATDGFNRKRSDDWYVEHVQVGPETWTIAN